MEFQPPGFSLAGIWGVNQWTRDASPPLFSFPITLPFNTHTRTHKNLFIKNAPPTRASGLFSRLWLLTATSHSRRPWKVVVMAHVTGHLPPTKETWITFPSSWFQHLGTKLMDRSSVSVHLYLCLSNQRNVKINAYQRCCS